MRRALLICAFCVTSSWGGGIAAAQTADAGVARASVRTRIERAPDGSLRRGQLDVPAWVAYAGGAVVALVAAGLLVSRIGRRRP